MATFSRLDDSFYSEGDDKGIKKFMEDSYTQALTINQAYWAEAEIDTRFKAGDARLWGELYPSVLSSQRNRNFNFNRIRPVINMMTGYQRRNRKSMVCVPVESSDQVTSSQLSKCLFWATTQDNVLHTISEAFEGALTTGMNLLCPWVDYRRDPVNGDIKVDNVGYSGYLIDPYFRKPDLSDCNFLWRRLWKSKTILKGMFAGREKEIDNIDGDNKRDGKFQYMPESYDCGMKNMLSLDEFWYMDTRVQNLLIDTETGDVLEYAGNEDTLNSFLAAHPNVTTKKQTVPSVKLVYLINGTVFYHGVNVYGSSEVPIDRYPFIPVLGYYDPELTDFSNRIQGVVRGLRDAQYLYTRRKIIELDIYESTVNSGWVYKPGSLIDPNDVYMTGQGKGIAIKDEADIADAQRIQPTPFDPGQMELSRLLAEEIQYMSSVNEELLGSADDDKAGILAMLRQGAGLTTLQKIFDQLDNSQKLLGEMMILMIQANFHPGKVKRIIEDDASPQFKDKAFQKYDIEIEEGLNTTTQKQMQFAQLLHLKEMGVPVPSKTLVDASTMQNKEDLLQDIQEQEQQQAKQEQEQMAMQIEVLKAQVNDLNSRALANNGLGIERISRVEENASLATQREAEAVENIASARLDKIRAIKELQEMDLNKVQRLLDIVNSLSVDSDEAEVKMVDDSKPKSKITPMQQLNSAA